MSMYCPYTYECYPQGLNYPWTFPMPSEKERHRRWQAIRKSMEKSNFDCIITTAGPTFMPATKYVQYISNYVPFATKGAYLVFPLKGKPQLLFSNAIGPQFVHMASETSWVRDIVGSFDPIRDVVKKIEQLGLQKGRLGILGYSSGIFSASDLDYLRVHLPEADFNDASAAVNGAMNEISRTSEEELKLLRKACEILDFSFDAVAEAFKPGATECDLWAAAEHAIIKNGGWPQHGNLVTTAPRPIFPRAPASHRDLSLGDIGIFEVTAIYGGVSPQTCYAISLGEPQPDVREMFKFCEGLYQFSLAELEKQRPFIDIEQDLAQRIHNAGFEPMTPQIHIYNMTDEMPMDSPPQPGDYFTVHPNFCDPKYTVGAKLGDCVRMTKDGKVERLNRPPARLNII